MTFADLVFNPNENRKCFINFISFNTEMPPYECKCGEGYPEVRRTVIETPMMYSPPKFMYGWQITTTKLI